MSEVYFDYGEAKDCINLVEDFMQLNPQRVGANREYVLADRTDFQNLLYEVTRLQDILQEALEKLKELGVEQEK